MAHYIIAEITIVDREEYSKYEQGFMEIFSQYNGKMLAVDENVHLLEGEWPATRTVIVEFPNKEDALDWYSSEPYQQLAKHRFAASEGNLIIVKGLDGE